MELEKGREVEKITKNDMGNFQVISPNDPTWMIYFMENPIYTWMIQ
jgi:hypothetical protein